MLWDSGDWQLFGFYWSMSVKDTELVVALWRQHGCPQLTQHVGGVFESIHQFILVLQKSQSQRWKCIVVLGIAPLLPCCVLHNNLYNFNFVEYHYQASLHLKRLNLDGLDSFIQKLLLLILRRLLCGWLWTNCEESLMSLVFKSKKIPWQNIWH